MFGSVILDVAVGLILMYLLLSLIATAVREGIEAMMKSRAVQLERGIRALLDDPQGKGLSERIYKHPLIYGLFEGTYESHARRRVGGNLPTYIPTKSFVQAVLDLTLRPHVPAPYTAHQTSAQLTIETLRSSIGRIDSPAVQRALRSAIDSSQGDIERVRKSLEAWYDSSMDRVSGWYKRQTSWVLIIIGITMAIIIDVDTVRVAQHLYRSPAQRAAAVAMAEHLRGDSTLIGGASGEAVRAATQAMARLDSLQLPILWQGVSPTVGSIGSHAAHAALGWLVTALAVSLGAPFWFDLLNKVMVIRSTVKPHEKSPEEASEDRQKPKSIDPTEIATAVGAAAAAVLGADRTKQGEGQAPASKPKEPEPPHTPREWADGVEDGIL